MAMATRAGPNRAAMNWEFSNVRYISFRFCSAVSRLAFNATLPMHDETIEIGHNRINLIGLNMNSGMSGRPETIPFSQNLRQVDLPVIISARNCDARSPPSARFAPAACLDLFFWRT